MESRDRQIGKNVASFRGARSQADIAKLMRARGWKWAQATLSSIEAGERPLRLAEAADLGKILGHEVSALLGGDPLSEVIIQTREAIKASATVERAAHDFVQAKSRLVLALEAAERELGQIPEAEAEVAERILATTVEFLSEEYRDRVYRDELLTAPPGESKWARLMREAEE